MFGRLSAKRASWRTPLSRLTVRPHWCVCASLCCALVLSALAAPARATLNPNLPIRQYILQTWQTAQGLPQNSVLSSAQTSDGYLWLGTEEGIVRFDGVRFTTFDTRTTGLQMVMIRALLVDHNQNLWIGTNGGGLYCLHNGKFTTYTSKNGLPSQSILSLYEDTNGVLWAGTDGGGLIRFENGQFHVFTKADGLPDNVIFALSGARDGTLWVGTHGGLSKSSGKKFVSVRPEGLGNDQIRCIRVSRRGDLWIGTNDGLYRVTGEGTTRFTTSDGLTSNAIFTLSEDRAGTLWIGTLGGGLNRFTDDKFSSFTEKDGLVGKDVWTILEDREGSLWVGTAGGGLNCLKEGSFTNLSKEDGLLSDMALSVSQDSEGSLWIGSDKGLVRLKNGKPTAYTMQQGLPENFVFSVTEGHDHEMWIGTRRGLARIKNEKITAFTAKNGLPSDFVGCTYTDHKGNVWLGTRGGLVRYDGRQFTTFTTLDGLSNNFVLSLYEDAQGTLWIGTSGGGLDAFKDDNFHAYTSRDGLSSDVVWALHGDSDGTLWVGTSGGGLDRFRNGKFTVYNSATGLFDDAPLAILDDHMGRLWMSSNRGVFSVQRDQLNAFAEGRIHSIVSTVYGTDDGMKSHECNGGFQPAGWRTKDGRLLFPTTKGVAVVDPAHLVKDEVPPNVVIEHVLVDNKEMPADGPLVTPPGKGQLEFQFTAPTFIAPQKLQFRYMLEGFDRDWVQAGSRRVAYYTNIPHGEYRFRVRAGIGDLWNTNNANVEISLEPHFYQTTVFNLLVLLAAFSLCAGAYRLRVSQLKMREAKLVVLVNERTSALQESEKQLRRSRDELEHRVQERTSELVETNKALGDEVSMRRRTEEQLILAKEAAEAASKAKSDFLANMSHEIRTPINGILGMTDIALSTELDEEQKEYLDIVKFSADSLLAIVNDILDFSKIEARKLTLDNSPFHLRKSIDELVRSLAIRARQKNLALTCDISGDVPDDVVGDPLRLRQVLLNLLDNALKFTSKGSVALSVTSEEQTADSALLHFCVTDTGIGISPDKQKTIFEAFSQADTSSTRRYGGTGLGLTISYQLAGMMGGRLWVASESGQGSAFHFTARLELNSPDPGAAGVPTEQNTTDVVEVT